MVETVSSSPSDGHRFGGRLASALAGLAASRIRYGTLVLVDRDGRRRFGSGAGDEPLAVVHIHDRRAYASLLRHGSVGLGRSYVAGWWDCDDLTGLVRILVHNLDTARASALSAPRPGLASRPWRRSPRRDRSTDRSNVQAHYDLSNEFFELMLDPTMMYSCAVFESEDETLEHASVAKLERICRRLELRPGDHVLEIGGGWGGFAVHAAAVHGCRVTTTTISDAQYDYTAKRVADMGLATRVTVLNEDYRDLRGTFDKLVSIEMIEAIGWQQFDTFFACCSRLLRRDGLMVLQAIVIDERSYERAKHRDDFIKAMVFPGGCLPSIGSIARSGARSNLQVIGLDDIGLDYAQTLRRWRANFTDHLDAVTALGLDAAFRRLWDLYLCYCQAAFTERHVSDVQVVLAKPDRRPAQDGPAAGVAGRPRTFSTA